MPSAGRWALQMAAMMGLTKDEHSVAPMVVWRGEPWVR
jgi:hypothetical protein